MAVILLVRIRTLLLLAFLLTLPGCMTSHIMTEPDCINPASVSYSRTTQTAYFWGLMQPVDFSPPCDPRANHLNGVTVKSTFGHYLLTTLTLGIVTKRRIEWCCMPYVPDPQPIGTDSL